MKVNGTEDDAVNGKAKNEGVVTGVLAGPEYGAANASPRNSGDGLVVVDGDQLKQQAGVTRIEAIAKTWTKKSLFWAYVG